MLNELRSVYFMFVISKFFYLDYFVSYIERLEFRKIKSKFCFGMFSGNYFGIRFCFKIWVIYYIFNVMNIVLMMVLISKDDLKFFKDSNNFDKIKIRIVLRNNDFLFIKLECEVRKFYCVNIC